MHNFGTQMQQINTNIPGLKIRAKSYQLRKMVAGIHIQKNLGRTDEISLQDAEVRAVELVNAVKEQGQFALDNFDRRKKAGMVPVGSNQNSTLGDIARELVHTGKTNGTRKTGNKPWKNSTVVGWEDWIQSKRMSSLINEPLVALTQQNIVDWYTIDLRTEQRTATDNAFRKLRRVIAWAIGDGIVSEDITLQMAHNQRRVVVPKRNTRLEINRGEPGRFALTLANYEGKHLKRTGETIKHLLLMSVITGRRTSELKKMEWSWIDLERGLITIPGEVVAEDDFSNFEGTKNRQDFVIPMARIVRTMMHERKELNKAIRKQALNENDSRKAKAAERFVFLGRDNRKPITNFRKTFESILNAAKVDRIIPHDLRRTFADIVSIEGADFYTTQLAMGHTVHAVTADYLGEMSLRDKTLLFQKVANWLSQSMPLEGITVDGNEYSFSGKLDKEEDSETDRDGRAFSKDALELLMFPTRIWRKKWVQHDGFEDAVNLAEIASVPRATMQ